MQAFLAAYPAPAPTDYSEAKTILGDVVTQLTDHSIAQLTGRNLSQAERQRQLVLLKRLRERHLHPIVTIARANRVEMPGIDRALRMPGPRLGVLIQLSEAGAIREAAAKYPPVFVKYGRPADFLKQLSAAIAAVEQATLVQARSIGDGAGAKAGIAQQLRRGRTAVDMLDAIVKVAFEGNDVVLRAWEIAKRVKAVRTNGAAVRRSRCRRSRSRRPRRGRRLDVDCKSTNNNSMPAHAGRMTMDLGGGVHTVPATNGRWRNEIDGKVLSRHQKKEVAVEAGREIAKRLKVEHTIQKADGAIGEKNSYGNDPFPPRDSS